MRRGPVRVSLLAAAGPHERPAVVGCVLVRCTDSPCANSQKYRKVVMITRSLGSKVIMGYLRLQSRSIKINQDQSRSIKINQASNPVMILVGPIIVG